MGNKAGCLPFQSILACILAGLSILATVGGLFYYFGREAKGSEATASESARVVSSYVYLSEQVRKQGEDAAATKESVKNMNSRLDRIESKIDKLGR